MLALWWLLTIGILTGLVTRTVVGGEAYGLVADALLGITGAFAVDWMLGVVTHTTISWSNCTLFTIWGAAALPLLAHFFARRQTRQVKSKAWIFSAYRDFFSGEARKIAPSPRAHKP